MKVFIGKYKSNWISPYTILEKVFFWRKNYDAFDHEPPKWLEKLCQLHSTVANKINPRVEYVHIDKYDTWSMDHTLAKIIVPMLKQLKETKHGVPSQFVRDDSDDALEQGEKEWNAVMDEMIWSFEQVLNDTAEEQFYSGTHDRLSVPVAWDKDGKPTIYEWRKGPNDTFKVDMKGLKAHCKRKQKGFELFGKYYLNLWD